tara:strand:- start:2053 stop:2505 length:453 start_codon:yes stop_codon:yes gene_type:complete
MGIRPTVSVHRKQRSKLPKRAPRPKGVKVGFPAGQAGDGVIDKAIYNHFGTETIPERPFLTNAMRDNAEKYRRQMRVAALRILISDEPDEQMVLELRRLGIVAVNDIKAEIVSLSDPPNSPLTIALKGSSNPLIDSGELHNAVTWKLEHG